MRADAGPAAPAAPESSRDRPRRQRAMSGECCGGDRNADDDTAPRTVWIILAVVMIGGWAALAAVLLSR
ncbi:hypothetical protein Aca07nite_67300 [Actinoplanes capillaceus]|uniref:MYXO-CTERM domain-containing protein n=1 Tax=Actinoplanes campanulatus TaxID=113559 RepID=A0ABQ3WTF8_9ACTN|nr:hypothetical protein Aca07nite_67300 [Actinoplanes capillaceus]